MKNEHDLDRLKVALERRNERVAEREFEAWVVAVAILTVWAVIGVTAVRERLAEKRANVEAAK